MRYNIAMTLPLVTTLTPLFLLLYIKYASDASLKGLKRMSDDVKFKERFLPGWCILLAIFVGIFLVCTVIPCVQGTSSPRYLALMLPFLLPGALALLYALFWNVKIDGKNIRFFTPFLCWGKTYHISELKGLKRTENHCIVYRADGKILCICARVSIATYPGLLYNYFLYHKMIIPYDKKRLEREKAKKRLQRQEQKAKKRQAFCAKAKSKLSSLFTREYK